MNLVPHKFQFPGLYLPEFKKLVALLLRLDSPKTIRTITGTTGALTAADLNAHIRTTSGSATTLTVPTAETVAFPVGAEITVVQGGAGAVTIAAASGVTLNKLSTVQLQVLARYGEVKLRKVDTNTWDVTGSLAAV